MQDATYQNNQHYQQQKISCEVTLLETVVEDFMAMSLDVKSAHKCVALRESERNWQVSLLMDLCTCTVSPPSTLPSQLRGGAVLADISYY
jgi:hypothetical protein